MVTGPEELHHCEKYLEIKSITELLFQIDNFATFERKIKTTFERKIKTTKKITLYTFS